MCLENRDNNSYSHTFGCLDPVQVVQMAPHLSSVYVSGWQVPQTLRAARCPLHAAARRCHTGRVHVLSSTAGLRSARHFCRLLRAARSAKTARK
jgi:hypothetical protein